MFSNLFIQLYSSGVQVFLESLALISFVEAEHCDGVLLLSGLENLSRNKRVYPSTMEPRHNIVDSHPFRPSLNKQ